jgi:hypothetical protein
MSHDHFDPRLKNTPGDCYENWYAILAWVNTHKPKSIEPFLPILHPKDAIGRIIYNDGIFMPVSLSDTEAKNLIDFIGLNKMELFTARKNHVGRIKEVKDAFENPIELCSHLKRHRENLSYATALRAELGIDVLTLIVSAP